MPKVITNVFVLAAMAAPAMAAAPAPVPGPVIDGGILGLVLVGGVVYLMNRRGRTEE